MASLNVTASWQPGYYMNKAFICNELALISPNELSFRSLDFGREIALLSSAVSHEWWLDGGSLPTNLSSSVHFLPSYEVRLN